jgi:hypothetical protein
MEGGRRLRVGQHALDFIALLCMLKAIGAQPQPALIVLAYASAGLLALIPLTPEAWDSSRRASSHTDARRPDGTAGGRRDARLQARLVLATDSAGGIAYVLFGAAIRKSGSAEFPARGQQRLRFASGPPARRIDFSQSNRESPMDSIIEQAGNMANTDLKHVAVGARHQRRPLHRVRGPSSSSGPASACTRSRFSSGPSQPRTESSALHAIGAEG